MTVHIESTGEIFRDIWEMIEPKDPMEAMNLRIRCHLMFALELRIREWGLTQKEAAKRLGISQPRLNQLLKRRFNDFSLDALVALLGPAGLELDFTVKAA
jgi:predicted XRE-type DNA-binding protein